MNKHRIRLLLIILCLAAASCARVLDNVKIDGDVLSRIDAVNETLRAGVIQIAPETRQVIRELNQTLRQFKISPDQATLQRIDELLRIVEDGLKIGLDAETLDTVNDLVDTLDRAPEKWQTTGEAIIQALEQAAGTTSKRMAEDVKGVIDTAFEDSTRLVASVGIEFRCNVDFLSARAGETVQKFIGRTIVGKLREILSGKKAADIPPSPWVCQILPDQVDLVRRGSQLAAAEPLITITGFNLQYLTPAVAVHDEAGQEIAAIHLPPPVVNTSYQIQLNLQGIDFSPAPVRAKISIRWPDIDSPNEIALIQPAEPPIADFTASPRDGVAPLSVQFTDKSTGDATGWMWYFGDGETSSDQNPLYTYGRAGSYTVTLIASNEHGDSEPVEKVAYIAVAAPELPPVADFTADPASGIAPLTVRFTDLSQGERLRYRWDFGDGATSTESSPTHTYQDARAYIATLEVSNDLGASTAWKTIAVNPVPPVYRADAFHVRHYSFTGGVYKTDIKASEQYCGIFGYHAHGATTDWILANFMQWQSLQIYTRRTTDGLWEIIASPAGSVGVRVAWDVDLLCIGTDNAGAYVTASLPAQPGEWAAGGTPLTVTDPATGGAVPSDAYTCAVAGLRSRTRPYDGGAIQSDGGNQGSILTVSAPAGTDAAISWFLDFYPTAAGGAWSIQPNMRLDNESDMWQVDVLCLKRDGKTVYDFAREQDPGSRDPDFALQLAARVGEMETVIKQDGTAYRYLVCGVAGVKAEQTGVNTPKAEEYDSQLGRVVLKGGLPCESSDCTIVNTRMWAPAIPAIGMPKLNGNWNVAAQIMWAEMRTFPAKNIDIAICGDSKCDPVWFTVREHYQWNFATTAWTVKPLCVYVSMIEQVAPGPIQAP